MGLPPMRGDVAPAKIGDGDDAGEMRDAGRIADLERERQGLSSAWWAMANGLAVAADGTNCRVRYSRSAKQGIDGLRQFQP